MKRRSISNILNFEIEKLSLHLGIVCLAYLKLRHIIFVSLSNFFFFLYIQNKRLQNQKRQVRHPIPAIKNLYLRSTAHKVNKINNKLIKRKLIL